MNKALIGAIQNLQVISLTYDGVNRYVEPHAYGVTAKGNQVLRCYQTAGGHNSERLHAWELLTVGKISNLMVLERTFAIRPDYKKGDKAMSQIYAEV